MPRRFRAPIRAAGDGFVVDVSVDEAALLRRLVDELRELLTDDQPGAAGGQRAPQFPGAPIGRSHRGTPLT